MTGSQAFGWQDVQAVGGRLRRAARCLALLAVASVSPAAAQTLPDYDVTQFQNSLGPVAVAYRPLTRSERGSSEYTHEIRFAHPAWGFGYYGGRFYSDCRGSSGNRAGMKRWDGSSFGEEFERWYEQPVYQILGYELENHILDAILCRSGPVELRTRKVAAEDIDVSLLLSAGPHTQPWRLHTLTLSDTDRKMRFAAPAESNHTFEDWIDFNGPNGLGWSAGIMTFRAAQGVRPIDTINHMIAQTEYTVVSRKRIVSSSSYTREQVVTRDENGLQTINHLLVCANRPGIVYGTVGEYRTAEEQILALRFVNSLEVWC